MARGRGAGGGGGMALANRLIAAIRAVSASSNRWVAASGSSASATALAGIISASSTVPSRILIILSMGACLLPIERSLGLPLAADLVARAREPAMGVHRQRRPGLDRQGDQNDDQRHQRKHQNIPGVLAQVRDAAQRAPNEQPGQQYGQRHPVLIDRDEEDRQQRQQH